MERNVQYWIPVGVQHMPDRHGADDVQQYIHAIDEFYQNMQHSHLWGRVRRCRLFASQRPVACILRRRVRAYPVCCNDSERKHSCFRILVKFLHPFTVSIAIADATIIDTHVTSHPVTNDLSNPLIITDTFKHRIRVDGNSLAHLHGIWRRHCQRE
jgi:hypothetical protein